MNRTAIKFLRSCRHVALVALSPLDYLSRLLNHKTDLPPLHLRRYVGPLRSFESSGAEFMDHLRRLAELQPHECVLDLGCGCGQMALQLKHYLNDRGRYVGVDIHGPSIRWCQKKIRDSNFEFAQIDVRNFAFNPAGKHPAESFRLPFEDRSFDVILLKSVFTHMRPAEVSNYLGEVSRLLKDGGRCLATFFLLNEQQQALAAAGRNTIAFDYGEGVWRYRYEHSPESAVAYFEDHVRTQLTEHGLSLKKDRIYYGTWSGRTDGLSYQDVLLLEKS